MCDFEDKFDFENSQYFAIAYAKLFNCKVCLWLDTVVNTTNSKKTQYFRQAFVQICPGLYADAFGGFTNISSHYQGYDHNEVNVKVCDTIDEAKQILRKLKVPYTDPAIKQTVLQFLSNNVLCFEYDVNKLFNRNHIQKLGEAVITDAEPKEPDTMYFRDYLQDKQIVTVYKKSIQLQQFLKMLTGRSAYVTAENWRKYICSVTIDVRPRSRKND